MKKYTGLLLMAITGMFVMLQSCKKHSHDTQYVTLNETIQPGATYTLNLNTYGDADDVPSITTQPKNYTLSQISKDAVTSNNIYSFSAGAKTTDLQTAVITLKEQHPGGPGRDCNRDAVVITINFTVN